MRKHICILTSVCAGLLFVTGCIESTQRNLSHDVNVVQGKVDKIVEALNKVEYGSDETINLLRIIDAGNKASAPWNPFALPIGVGLTGVITVIEAMRRSEKGKRQYAEHELNNNNKKGNHG